MRVFGIDFTSSPRSKKPIAIAVCHLKGNTLHVLEFKPIYDFNTFRLFMEKTGPWIAGVDFPIGLPARLIKELGWPSSWEGYISKVSKLSQSEFVHILDLYRQCKPAGQKHQYRETDRLAGALSPMMVYGVPVGRMFHAGAPILMKTGVCVHPCRRNDADRVVVEAYPALLARKVIGRQKYKNETRNTPEIIESRRALIEGLMDGSGTKSYGITVEIPSFLVDQSLHDHKGDTLDAINCAIQAAWSFNQPGSSFGIPDRCSIDEGWIVDPGISD